MLSPEMYDITPDLKICACANSLKDTENLVFVSDDICCRTIAREIFGLNCSSAYKPDVPYSGFSEVIFDDKQLAYFYEHLSENQFNLLINQYLIVKNKNNETIDKFKWNGEYYKTVVPKTIKSAMFGTIRPFDDF
jgi:PhoH-like ATPase